MKFHVTIEKQDGTRETRDVEAESKFEVYGEIEKEGAVVLSLTEKRAGLNILSRLAHLQLGNGFNIETKILFAKNLSAMLTAGLALSRALSVIERQSPKKAVKKVIADLEERIRKGSAFHEALGAHQGIFSRLFIAMVKAGEESGSLSGSLAVVSKQMERSHRLVKKVRGAMIYPAVIIMAMIIIGILMLIYVVPTLSSTFASFGVELPLATRVIVFLSGFMVAHSLIVLGGLSIVVIGGILFVRSRLGANIVLHIAYHLPVIGELLCETYSARAARSLSSLLSSGVDVLTALSITREIIGVELFASAFREAEERVRKGEPLSLAFANRPKLYPILFIEMIMVGEETGGVADMLGQVAEYYETDVEERTKDLSTIIEPILILMIGAGVGGFAISMISPIYSITSKI